MQVFVWGETPFQTFNTPVETEAQSLDEAFCVFGTGAMYKTIHIGIESIFFNFSHDNYYYTFHQLSFNSVATALYFMINM